MPPKINSKNTTRIITAITANNRIPNNLPHPRFLIKAKISLKLNAAFNSSFATILHIAMTSNMDTNIANTIATRSMIPPIAFTEGPTALLTVNINPRRNTIPGKMEYAIPTMILRIPFRNIPLMSLNSGSSYLPSIPYLITSYR